MKMSFLLCTIVILCAVSTLAEKRAQTGSQWCCEIDLGTTEETVTKTVWKNFTRIITVEKVITYFHHMCEDDETPDHLDPLHVEWCDLRANQTSIMIDQKPVTETFKIPQKDICPTAHIICCDGYVMKAGQCIGSDAASESSSALDKLLQAGLLG